MICLPENSAERITSVDERSDNVEHMETFKRLKQSCEVNYVWVLIWSFCSLICLCIILLFSCSPFNFLFLSGRCFQRASGLHIDFYCWTCASLSLFRPHRHKLTEKLIRSSSKYILHLLHHLLLFDVVFLFLSLSLDPPPTRSPTTVQSINLHVSLARFAWTLFCQALSFLPPPTNKNWRIQKHTQFCQAEKYITMMKHIHSSVQFLITSLSHTEKLFSAVSLMHMKHATCIYKIYCKKHMHL